jgi:octaprenyl-diphosphate synthase
MNLKEISQPINSHLTEFGKFYRKKLESNVSLLNLILKYINQKTGKRIRPVLVFLSAEATGGINERSYTGAAMVELLHTATLIHDDVVDKAKQRRGLASINAEWNNKIAVLIGDYLLSQGLISATETNEFQFLHSTSNAVKRMSRGELLSIDRTRNITLDEESYFSIISDKTASLLASCCEIGAISATEDKEIQNSLREYGENLGIAFQIRDDIFDFISKSSLIGKPVGNDIKEKKVTLPLMYALKQVTEKESDSILKKIKKGKLEKSEIKEIIKFTFDKGGIEYAENTAKRFSDKAKSNLDMLENTPAKESLLKLADFVITRES